VNADPQTYRAPLRWGLFGPRYWPTWVGLGMLWLLHQLPRKAIHALVPAVSWALAHGSRKVRRRAEINVAWCFPELSEAQRQQLLAESYRHTARALLDYGLLWFGSEAEHRRHTGCSGDEHYLRAREKGRPVILLSPHAIAIDHGGQGISRMTAGVSFAKPMRNPVVEWINLRARTRYGSIIYAREQGLRAAIRQMRQGRVFYFLPDEDLGSEGSVFADFFGVPKATLTSPIRIARMTGAVVLPVFTYYDATIDRYTMRIWPPLADFPSGDDTTDARTLNAAIETMIRVSPAEHFWALRLFKTRPEGGSNPYAPGADARRPETGVPSTRN